MKMGWKRDRLGKLGQTKCLFSTNCKYTVGEEFSNIYTFNMKTIQKILHINYQKQMMIYKMFWL